MEWADTLVWQAVLISEDARSDKKVKDYFYHLHLVQQAFLRAWRGEPRDTPYPTFEDAYALMRWGSSYYGELPAHLASLTEKQITQVLKLPWTDVVERELGRAPQNISIAESMFQVPLHSLYHRGQINARLREVGGEPPRVDYIVWAWLGRPAPDWESVPQQLLSYEVTPGKDG
jgi:uncharacterized damage-inducible protein DinB